MVQMKEEEEYLDWLKGQKQTMSKDNKTIAAELVVFATHCYFSLSVIITTFVFLSRLGCIFRREMVC